MYTELFKLCGYETEEIERERPRIDKAFEKAEIGREDIQRAESRVEQYFDISLIGVRKGLGIWMKQFIDLVLAREEGKKIVYPSYPSLPMIGLAINLCSESEEVYCQAPEVVLDVVMGQIFGKLDPILEAAEAHGLLPGLGHCSLNQARVGGIVKGIVPIPDLALTTGFFCDQTPKTDELLHEVYGVPNVYIDSVMDPDWDEYPEISPRRVRYSGAEMRKAIEKSEEVLGIKVSDEALDKSLAEISRLYFALLGLWELMKRDPMPLSQVDLGLFFWVVGSPERRAMAEAFEAIATLTKEVKQRADEGKGVVEKGAPRVMFFVHQATDPSIMHMVEDVGLAIPLTCSASLTGPMGTSFGATQYTTFEERAINMILSHGLCHSTTALIHRHKELGKAWDIDGVVNLYPFSCRPFAIQPLMAKRAIEEELGIPVLALEGDIWDTRDYSAQALRTRVETFAEMLRAAKAAKVG